MNHTEITATIRTPGVGEKHPHNVGPRTQTWPCTGKGAAHTVGCKRYGAPTGVMALVRAGQPLPWLVYGQKLGGLGIFAFLDGTDPR